MSYLLSYSKWKKLHEAANGEIPSSDLEAIPVLSGEAKEKHSLNPIAAEAYSNMVAAAKADGIEWGITDSYRPLEVQKRLAKEKGLYSKGGLAAEPGTSNHGWGSAVDLDFKQGSGDAAYQWLKNNAAKFGFSTIKREPWHWEHKESAKTIKAGETSPSSPDTQSQQTQLINKFVDEMMAKPSIATLIKNKNGITYMSDADRKELAAQFGVSIPELTDWSTGKIKDRDFIFLAVKSSLNKNTKSPDKIQAGLKLLKSGSTGEDVTELQKKLKEKGFFTKEPNGTFDSDTYSAVKAFQQSEPNPINPDGIVGPITYAKLYDQPIDPSQIGKVQVAQTSGPVSVSGKLTHSYTGERAANINLLIQTMEKNGITNPYSQAGILAVIGKETNYIPKNEIMDYSKERLPEVWGEFSKTGKSVGKGLGKDNYNDLAVEYEHQPEKLANFVYGQKPNGMRDNGYGNTQPGDGWKYRGRGFNQVTFKSGYDKLGKEIGMDLVTNPDIMNDPKIAADVAVRFFKNRFKEKGLDPNQFTDVDSALVMFAKANAGWGSDPSTAIAAARQKAPAFAIA